MLGFCPAILRTVEQVAEQNAPSRKLHIAGFLAALFCCQNSSVNPLNDQFEGSHYRGLTVKYRKRPTLAHVQDDDNCDVNRIPEYGEWNIPTLGYKQSSFYISDDTMQRYCSEASAIVNVNGAPVTGVMAEIYSLILEHANIVMKAINIDLVTEMATEFGVNVTTGSATGKVLNIQRDGDKLELDNGVIDMMRDLQENEICGTPCIVGGGLFAAYEMSRLLQCCNGAGIDMSRMSLPTFFFDKDTQNIWGANTVGVLAPGSVKFIGRNKFTGAFSGQRGADFYMTLPLPVQEFGCNLDDCLGDLVFDVHLRYINCPTEVVVNGVPQTVNRGWQVIISKSYALWVQPEDAYEDDDELAGTNGTLKYFFTNTSGDSSAYAYPA